MSSSAPRRVTSNQHGPHRALAAVVEKHRTTVFRKPPAAHTAAAFEQLRPAVENHAGPLILDAGCGVGESSRRLAERYPDALIIGVDKSADRLARRGGAAATATPSNCRLVRADLIDFWPLCAAAGWRPRRHYLLYPNPWPKAQHLRRRWHGSPLLPTIIALGGRLELRCNWEIYAREFAEALTLYGAPATAETFTPDTPLTPFERKYSEAGQTLWRVAVELRDRPASSRTPDSASLG